MFESIDETTTELSRHSYVADVGLSASVWLSFKMGKPLFLEGEPGVGKTEVAKVLATALGTELIRLQCFEGLDLHQALYEWNYPQQLLAIQAQQANDNRSAARISELYTEDFLLRRPLLRAIDPGLDRAPVLLIDEIDRADEEFESFLLELLSDFQVTIPEMGTIVARHRPIVIITSNRTREIHDALKRRCLYHWISYPSLERERAILRLKIPDLPETLSEQIVRFVQALRRHELFKAPGVAETLDWAMALDQLDCNALDESFLTTSFGLLLKYRDDVERIRGPIAQELLREAVESEG